MAGRQRHISYPEANRWFGSWISDIGSYYSSFFDDFAWFRVNTVGAFPDQPLFYVLLGPLGLMDKNELMNRWRHRCGSGDSEFEYVRPGGNGCEFIEKIAWTHTEAVEDIEVEIASDLFGPI